MPRDFSSLNDFEAKLVQGRRGEISITEIIASLAGTEIALPSAGEIHDDWSDFQPFLAVKEGTPMLACFSAKERMVDFVDMTPYCLMLRDVNCCDEFRRSMV